MILHRHPDFSLPHCLSHHEKVVVVDCSIAFVAEIDLCFGCWDTHRHEMVDNYSAHPYFEREIEAIPNACGIHQNLSLDR